MLKATVLRLADLWLPIGVFVIGAAVSLAFHQRLVGDREAHLHALAKRRALESARAVERELAARVLSLDELAALWRGLGPAGGDGRPLAAGLLVEGFPGVEALYHVHGDGTRALLAGRDGPAAAPGQLPGVAAGPTEDPATRREPLERAVVRAIDARTLRAAVPIDPARPAEGWLEARLSMVELLERSLRGVDQGYAIAVRSGDAPIFSLGSPTLSPGLDWWRAGSPIDLGGARAGDWTILLQPTESLAALRLSPVPGYLLVVGLLLSASLAALAHQLRQTRRQARFLSLGNAALERTTSDLMALNEELEARVAERTAELEDVVSELESFNHSVSHDLRSPLSAILNLTTILEEDYADRDLDDEAHELLGRIHRSAARGVALLEGLLQLSRAGRTRLETEVIDMEQLVREAFAVAREAEAGTDADLQLEMLPPCRGDRALVSDVLTNLLGNALKYSREQDKPWIRVTGFVEGERSVYAIEDNGQGFDQRFAGKLFGLFERLHRSEEAEGTGVGLAVVARIIRRHGGAIRAEGVVGRGARFEFQLPRAREGAKTRSAGRPGE